MDNVDTKQKEEKRREDRKLTRTFLDDLESPDLSQSFKRDLADVYNFYLDRESRDKLEEMNPFEQWIHVSFWIIREMFFRMTPVRRLMLVVGLFLALTAFYGPVGQSFVALLVILTVLILELKDKLLAQSELATGRAVQLALMPDSAPVVDGWDVWIYSRPANEVGGDLVDHMVVGPGRFSVSLGDVAGKGLGAAMYMAKLQATIRALAPTTDSLIDLAGHINSIFRRDGVPSRFASLIYLELAEGTNEVSILNAGHLPALHLSRDGIEAYPHGSPAIGLMDEASFSAVETTMASGDVLVLYSDGITEARDTESEFFGDRRLEKLLKRGSGKPAGELGRDIIEAVDRFVQDAPQYDDVSLVIIRKS
ncbi:MAG: serine/threonine-protein phosphatase [Rhodothermales bacterium]|nr:serine/threonine-protein phosphatase [Rhodothermales bacterium]